MKKQKTAIWDLYDEMIEYQIEHSTNEKGTYKHGVEWGIKLALDRISAHINTQKEQLIKAFNDGKLTQKKEMSQNGLDYVNAKYKEL